MAVVVNTHHFGGVDALPSGTAYIGRPSKRGNPYSSKDGRYTKEECVAFHRVHLYEQFVRDFSYFLELKAELEGKDLACWCKQPTVLKACHGDNYLHVLSDKCQHRKYDKRVLTYVAEDVRFALETLRTHIAKVVRHETYIDFFLREEELRIEIAELFSILNSRGISDKDKSEIIMLIVVDLELAAQETKEEWITYRMEHAEWVIHYTIDKRTDRDGEPPLPVKMRTPKKSDKGMTT